MPFDKLFQEGNIGILRLRNRIIMPLYPTKYSQDSRVNDRMLAFYKERAGGGAAMIVLDCPCLDYPAAYKGKNELRIDEPSYVKGIQKLLNVIHKEGARAFMHLNYPKERICDEKADGARQKKGKWVQPLVNYMTADDAREIILKMASGARIARETGYDGIEIQAGYGDLISQLLSPLSNKRGDDFGGPIENRARFLVELIQKVKQEAGKDFPVMVKLVCDEYMAGGLSLNDSKEIAKMTASAGADAIIANAGNKETKIKTIPVHSSKPGPIVHLANGIKEVVDIPVVAIGKINTPELADQIISEGKADFVAMARALVADPYLPLKALQGRREEIRGCIYCLEDCFENGAAGLGRGCSVNPFAGQEYLLELTPAKKRKKMAVIGGGPAGMQAAILASQRGHQVILFEKEDGPGGQFLLADRAPFKGEVKELLRYLNHMLGLTNVKVILNKEAGLEDIIAESPDVVVLATGSHPNIPDIQGKDLPLVHEVHEVYKDRPDPGKRIIIIGGGDIGCETADMLASDDREITIIEILESVLQRMKSIPGEELLGRLKEKNVKIMTGTRVTAIESGAVRIEDKAGNRSSLKADSVILSIGSLPEDSLLNPLKQKIPEVYTVGEAAQPGNIGTAIRSAAKVALTL
ncbi:MAG: FAD-dependent oxidoreductase [Nitrospinota bacterium]